MDKLIFTAANAKTKKLYKVKALKPYLQNNRKVYNFSLPAGYTCPGALDCLSKAVKQNDGTYKIVDGEKSVFRCFAASDEVRYKECREGRWHNFDILSDLVRNNASVEHIALVINDSLPEDSGIVRIHVSGDFFNLRYLLAWFYLARHMRPNMLFYAYTKSLVTLFQALTETPKPTNLALTLSAGGRYDTMIPDIGIRQAVVVYSEEEAQQLGLEIDDDDSHAADPTKNKDFALLIHGTQPKGSVAGKAVYAINKAKRELKILT